MALLPCLLLFLAPAQSIVGTGSSGAADERASGPRVRETRLAGKSLPAYPFFQFVRTFQEGDTIQVAVDPGLHPQVAGVAADVYVTADRSIAGWEANPVLTDVVGGPLSVTLSGAGIQANTYVLDAGTLSGATGTDFGLGYDVVVDLDGDGLLGDDDLIDGRGLEPAFWVVRDPTLAGPETVTEITYSGGIFLGQNTFYPSNIAAMGELPLVVVSHGNGHNYQWYDHIGDHLASWGYVVMSHENNTGPGVQSASLTTINNTQYFIANLPTIGGGVLDGHVDTSRIAWIGHSRGGEGVVRAYTRLRTGVTNPSAYGADDIQLVSSIAPVTFLSSGQSNPFDVDYFFLYGAADSDVTGSPSSGGSKPFALYERDQGAKQLVYLQGVGHAWFHNGGGLCWCTGPDLVGETITHQVVRGYYLPLAKRYLEGNGAALDFFTRAYDDFHPKGIDPALIAATEFKDPIGSGNRILDDFQTNPSTALSSSGGAVSFTVSNVSEGELRDQDDDFEFDPSVPMNGMTRIDGGTDAAMGVVFDWVTPSFYEVGVPPAWKDVRALDCLSFRACQGTRHPETDSWDAPVTFTVTLRDGSGTESSIGIANYGSVTRTYRRTGSGAGAGWANEFCTFRIPLADFRLDGSGLDLSDLAAVRFEFGAGAGSDSGRLGLDDVELTVPGGSL